MRKGVHYQASPDAFIEHLRQVLHKGCIDCVFDVGGNDGAFAHTLRNEVKYRGLIISFEPLRSKHTLLARQAAHDPLWIIQPCALGAAEGRAVLNIMDSDVFSSFLHPDHSHVGKYRDSNRIIDKEEVTVRTLANVYAEMAAMHNMRRCYLKIDTQGFDLEVFRGALPIIERVPAMQTELSFLPIYHGAPRWQDGLRELAEHGYEPSWFAPVCFDEPLRIIESDCILTHPARMTA